MNDNYFQGDLFNEKVLEKKKSRPRIFEKYSQQRVLSFIRLPIEYIVIYSIGVLILVIVSYAIGVERGKSLSASDELFSESLEFQEISTLEKDVIEEKEAAVIIPKVETEIPEENKEEIIIVEEKAEVAGPKDEEEKIIPEGIENKEIESGDIFIVQLASYKKLDSVKREMKNLESDGIKSGWKKSGDWYQLFARGYKTASEAKKARNKLISTYKDCYIKKVR